MANFAVLGPATRVGTSRGFKPGALGGPFLRVRTRLRRPWLDRRIARGEGRPDDSALALREAQLIGPRQRRRLARRLEGILADRPRPRAPSSAIPIDDTAVSIAKPVLTEIV